MQRIDGPTAARARPAAGPVSGTPGFFTGGDPAIPTAPTTVSVDWLNAIQEEIVAVIVGAGLDLSKADNAQLFAAIRALISSGGVAMASDAEAIAGVLANKALSPRAGNALVTDRITALLGGAPAALNTLGELAAALGNNPNFGMEVVAALADRVLTARRVVGTGLATGGGELSSDVEIRVTAATGVEFNAMTDEAKVLTPAAYGAGGGGDGATGWAPLPGGNIIQWGSLTVVGGGSNTRDFVISFPRPFLNVCGSIVGNADPQGAGKSTQPVTVEFYAPTIAGVTGRIDSGEENRRINNRIVRWQAIGR